MIALIQKVMSFSPQVVRLAKAVQPLVEGLRECSVNLLKAAQANLKSYDLSDPLKKAEETGDTSDVESALSGAATGFSVREPGKSS